MTTCVTGTSGKQHTARLFQKLINTIMPQDGIEEGCSGFKGPDEEADRNSAQEVTLPVDSESDLLAEEGCSGTTGQHKEAESKQEGIPPCDWDIDLSDSSKEHGNGNHARSEYSSDKGEHSPSRKRKNGLRNENIKSYVRFMF